MSEPIDVPAAKNYGMESESAVNTGSDSGSGSFRVRVRLHLSESESESDVAWNALLLDCAVFLHWSEY